MTSIPADKNSVRVAFGVLQSDGKTPAAIQASAASHGLNVNDGSTGTDQTGTSVAIREDNERTAFIVASSTDGKTPVVLYIDGSGNLLIKST